MPQAQAQMVMCKHAHPADVEGKISTADGMQRRSTVVWEITNSSSASSTTYATQSRVDIGQKGGGSKEGLAKGLGWRYVLWERIPLRGASRRRVSTRPEAIVTSRGSISRVTDGASGWTWNMAAQPTRRQKQSRHMTMVKWRIAGVG